MVTVISADINSATDSLSSSPCEFQNLVGAAITDAAIATGDSENRYRIKLTLNAPPGAIDIAFLVGGVSNINIAGSDN